MGGRSAGAALIEEEDVVSLWVEELAVHWDQTAARAAVQEDDWDAFGVADALVVDLVNVRDLEHARIEGFDLRIKRFHMP